MVPVVEEGWGAAGRSLGWTACKTLGCPDWAAGLCKSSVALLVNPLITGKELSSFLLVDDLQKLVVHAARKTRTFANWVFPRSGSPPSSFSSCDCRGQSAAKAIIPVLVYTVLFKGSFLAVS